MERRFDRADLSKFYRLLKIACNSSISCKSEPGYVTGHFDMVLLLLMHGVSKLNSIRIYEMGILLQIVAARH